MENKIKNTIKIIKVLLLVLFLVVFIKSISALSVPHGISGFIYTQDEITPFTASTYLGLIQVKEGTHFSVQDLTNNQYIQGTTGRGSNTGKYAVSIDGEDGDIIFIRTWNSQHQSNLTLTLNGVMSNVNLFLNTTIRSNITKPLPPKLFKFPGSSINITINNQTIRINKIPQPYILHGIIQRLNQMPRNQNVTVILINVNTNKTVKFTLTADNPPEFYSVIGGSKNDNIVLMIDNQAFKYKLNDKKLQDLKFMKTKKGFEKYNNKFDYFIKRVLDFF